MTQRKIDGRQIPGKARYPGSFLCFAECDLNVIKSVGIKSQATLLKVKKYIQETKMDYQLILKDL